MVFFWEKVKPSAELDTDSKPTKAQGESAIMVEICLIEETPAASDFENIGVKLFEILKQVKRFLNKSYFVEQNIFLAHTFF